MVQGRAGQGAGGGPSHPPPTLAGHDSLTLGVGGGVLRWACVAGHLPVAAAVWWAWGRGGQPWEGRGSGGGEAAL